MSLSLPALSGDVLTIEQQYHQDIAPFHPQFASREHLHAYERMLVARARCGDQQARHEMILSCQRWISLFAARYGTYIRALTASPRIEYLDLIGTANVVLAEKLDQALETDHPFAFLLRSAYGSIRHYCKRFESIILTPLQEQPIDADSLDAPRFDGEEALWPDILAAPSPWEADVLEQYAPLYQAIEALAPQQREVITRLFGVGEHGQETLQEVAAALCHDANKVAMVEGNKRRGLQALYVALLPAYAHALRRAAQTPAPVPKMELYLKEEAHRRLEAAYAALQARGENITTQALRSEARVDVRKASVYLRFVRGGDRKTLAQRRQQQRID